MLHIRARQLSLLTGQMCLRNSQPNIPFQNVSLQTMFQEQFVFLKWKLQVSGLVPKRKKEESDLNYAKYLLHAKHGMILYFLNHSSQHNYMVGIIILIL